METFLNSVVIIQKIYDKKEVMKVPNLEYGILFPLEAKHLTKAMSLEGYYLLKNA